MSCQCELVVRHSLIQGVGVSHRRCPSRSNDDAYFRYMEQLNHYAIAGETECIIQWRLVHLLANSCAHRYYCFRRTLCFLYLSLIQFKMCNKNSRDSRETERAERRKREKRL